MNFFRRLHNPIRPLAAANAIKLNSQSDAQPTTPRSSPQSQLSAPKERFILRLPNIGNTCHFNSAVQALLCLQKFRDMITYNSTHISSQDHSFMQYVEPNNKELCLGLNSLMNIASDQKNPSSPATPSKSDQFAAPSELMHKILSTLPQFPIGLPHDAQEVTLALLEQIEANYISYETKGFTSPLPKPAILTELNNNMNQTVDYNQVSNVFSSSITQCTCPDPKPLIRNEKMLQIPLSLVQYHDNSLLRTLTNKHKEIIDQQHINHDYKSIDDKKQSINLTVCAPCNYKLPLNAQYNNQVFFSSPDEDNLHFGVTINRYDFDFHTKRPKYINSPINIPLHLPMIKYTNQILTNDDNIPVRVDKMLQYTNQVDIYRLQSFLVYQGNGDSGHYTAYGNLFPQCYDNSWVKFDDSCVSYIPIEEVKQQASHAYVLYYTKQPEIKQKVLAQIHKQQDSLKAKL